MDQHIRWKPVYGYGGIYEVNNFGHIRTLNRKDRRYLRQQTSESGHKYVMITNDQKIRKKKYVHVAVLEAFVCPRPKGKEVRHLDGNAANNSIFNLFWGTHAENMQDSIRHGTFNYVGVAGSKHHNAILNEKQVLKIKKLLQTTSLTQSEIGKKYNVTNDTISAIKRQKIWKHVQV